MLEDRFVSLDRQGITLHVREAVGEKPAFVLSHGLSSNCLTWEPVARILHRAGHRVVTVDQRGHGRSQKPVTGYGFQDVTADMVELFQTLDLERPIFVGQSWGGNVALHLGATHPQAVRGLGFIDGGFLDLQSAVDAEWEKTKARLTPPPLAGQHIDAMRTRMRQYRPEWSAEGIENTLGNFKVNENGLIQPNLTLENHMRILEAMWHMRPAAHYEAVRAPTLICPARSTADAEGAERKSRLVEVAAARIPRARVAWFEETDHDIHVHRPAKLAGLLLETMDEGIWSQP